MTGRATVAGMTQDTDPRPHLTDARIKANETYKRRKARTAVDELLEIDPKLWDEHTRRTVVETLPRLARIELWEIRALEQGEPRPLEAAWCDGQFGYGIRCGLPEGHMGMCDPDAAEAYPVVPIRPDPLAALRVQQDTGCPDCWQDHGALHTESCRVAIELRRKHDNGHYRA